MPQSLPHPILYFTNVLPVSLHHLKGLCLKRCILWKIQYYITRHPKLALCIALLEKFQLDKNIGFFILLHSYLLIAMSYGVIFKYLFSIYLP